ncbi:hypothetical protein AVEN_229182-1 [Araneus ventricosus]|uniref:Uncharacterized protein n=1 Tax=Araneus ventricosus TaxID=182803 RepID=A0A4Y2HLV9_ARAVE|nr:hypothetical protein AVEN_229182-1 [Araneus ventricosus]
MPSILQTADSNAPDLENKRASNAVDLQTSVPGIAVDFANKRASNAVDFANKRDSNAIDFANKRDSNTVDFANNRDSNVVDFAVYLYNTARFREKLPYLQWYHNFYSFKYLGHKIGSLSITMWGYMKYFLREGAT